MPRCYNACHHRLVHNQLPSHKNHASVFYENICFRAFSYFHFLSTWNAVAYGFSFSWSFISSPLSRKISGKARIWSQYHSIRGLSVPIIVGLLKIFNILNMYKTIIQRSICQLSNVWIKLVHHPVYHELYLKNISYLLTSKLLTSGNDE